jgi:aspartyl-tRNA(Asn)/glutamyl-tRNA(Gln) amidotransferase subunit B
VKEGSDDYRYFPEPDLPPLIIDPENVKKLGASLPELPDARRVRYQEQYGLSEQEANVMTEDKALGDYFELVIAASQVKEKERKVRAKAASNWLLSEVVRLTNAHGISVQESRLRPEALVNLLDLLDKERVTGKQAKDILDEAFTSGEMPEAIVEKKGIKPPISDQGTLERIIDEVLAKNEKAVIDYRNGKTNAVQMLIGQVMKQTRGQAKADIVQSLLRKKLDETQG